MASIIRPAREGDAEAIAGIYAPAVSGNATSFETDPPGPAEMARRVRETMARFPWLVCEDRGRVLGYAYASRHRDRAAYQWSVEVSVYIHPEARRTGVGRALYTSLFEVLKLQGFHNAYAGITLPNPASVGLHEAMGFTPVGTYRAIGFKMGAWHDVGWWEKTLKPHGEAPSTPRDFPAIRETPACAEAMGSGERLIRSRS